MKLLISAILLISASAFAGVIDPGLWNIKMEITQNGEKFNPMNEIQKAMKDMPEDQKKQMQQAMEDSGMNVDEDGMKQCYTQDMIEKAELGVHEDKDCRTETIKKTKKKIISKFECKDGSKGTATIDIKSKKSYVGNMEMTDAKGVKSKMKYNANFIDKECGNLKPKGA